MAFTYESIATTTVASASASVTMSSIPSTYTDLVVIVYATDSTSEGMGMYFNGDVGTNYSFMYFYDNGSGGVAAGQNLNTTRINFANLSPTISLYTSHILNYANTTTFKPVFSNGGLATEYVIAYTGNWRSTAAINSITFNVSSGTIGVGSIFNLYGIKAA